MKIHTLDFINRDAAVKTVTLDVSTESIEPIMTWYGAYYAGDNYSVYVDGKIVTKDQNGELIGELPT